jgi:hypothetical protein
VAEFRIKPIQPRSAIIVSQGNTGCHFGFVFDWVKIIGIKPGASGGLGQHLGHSGFPATGNSHDDEDGLRIHFIHARKRLSIDKKIPDRKIVSRKTEKGSCCMIPYGQKIRKEEDLDWQECRPEYRIGFSPGSKPTKRTGAFI